MLLKRVSLGYTFRGGQAGAAVTGWDRTEQVPASIRIACYMLGHVPCREACIHPCLNSTCILCYFHAQIVSTFCAELRREYAMHICRDK